MIESASAADYIPNMTSLARAGYDLIIGVGFAQGDAVGKVAQRFPNVRFAIIDVDQAFVPGKPANVQGLLFREEEVGYLVGYLAGLEEARRDGSDVISAVGGMKEPPVDRFIAGYFAGAEKAAPGIKTILDYSQDWDDQAKCKELALNQIARGSNIIFQVAGGCGLGALNAAGERDRWGIGVDADQSFLGPHILTSAQKGVDAAVFLTIGSVKDGTLEGRRQLHLRLEGGGRRAGEGERGGATGRRRPGRGDQAADRRRRDHRHPDGGRSELAARDRGDDADPALLAHGRAEVADAVTVDVDVDERAHLAALVQEEVGDRERAQRVADRRHVELEAVLSARLGREKPREEDDGHY